MVLALPKKLGGKSRREVVAHTTAPVSTIPRSRLNTSTVTFQGILWSTESTRNSVLSSSLSAMGSSSMPSAVFCFSRRARMPSRKSENPASTSSPSAQP